MTPTRLAGLITAIASVAVGLTLMVVKADPVALLVAGVGGAIGLALMVVGRGTGGSEAPAPDKARFAAAFAKTLVPHAPGGAPASTGAGVGADSAATEGAATLAVRFVPDTSVAPIPGFAEVYQKIASGEIRGHLMVVGGPDRGRGVEIKDEALISVGRGRHHTLNLKDPGVSNDQCEVLYENGSIVVRDIGSKNGTFVNNQRIARRVLENCDIIACGSTKMLMTLPG